MKPVMANLRCRSLAVARARGQRLWTRGVTALEFALVAPWVILVLFFSIEMGILTWADASLEVTAGRVTRIGQLGVPAGQTCDQAVDSALENGVGSWLSSESSLLVDVQVYKPGVMPDVSDPDYEPGCDAGDRGDMVIYRIGFDRPGFSGIMSWLDIDLLRFERTIIIQNEP
ncbi:MAG: pilus assembly protein [Burkholderiaceae bacterium]|nr:pilus assembly protein [Burkholderiaceae bacterium]